MKNKTKKQSNNNNNNEKCKAIGRRKQNDARPGQANTIASKIEKKWLVFA